MNAIIVRPPPNVSAPTLRRNAPTCKRLAAGGSPGATTTPGTDADRATMCTTARLAASHTRTVTPSLPGGKGQGQTPPARSRVPATPRGRGGAAPEAAGG